MKEFKDVHGSKESSKELIIGKTTVYVHSNIRENKAVDEITKEEYTDYIYDEIQYTKDEYIELIGKDKEKLENRVNDLTTAIADMMGEM